MIVIDVDRVISITNMTLGHPAVKWVSFLCSAVV